MKCELVSGVSAREVTTLTGNLGSHVGGGGIRTPNLYDTGLVLAPAAILNKPNGVTTRPRSSLLMSGRPLLTVQLGGVCEASFSAWGGTGREGAETVPESIVTLREDWEEGASLPD